MKWTRVPIVAGLLLVASPLLSEVCFPRGGMTYLFNESKQKHPKVGTLAVPIMAPVIGIEGDRLTFEVGYRTLFYADEDPRNSKGKVIVRVQVIRDDQVVWKGKKKSRIKYDRYTTWECGNCTHNLSFENEFEGGLYEGDLVLFKFTFKRMPRFEMGEAAEFGAGVY